MADKKENTGDRNTGDRNTGDRNTGYWNTGDRNTGYWNTGDRNTGDWNTGDWNTGNRNTGYLNTGDPTVRMFNKDTGLQFGEINFPNYFYFDLTEWIYEEDMTDQEKEDHKAEYKITGGYLKENEWLDCWKKAWEKATPEDREKTLKLPNFDAKIFKEITGIDTEEEVKKETIKIGELEFDKSEVERRLKDLKPIK